MELVLTHAPAAAAGGSTKLKLKVQAVRCLTERIIGIDLVAQDGATLPPFTAGAHLDVHLPGGLIRQYSLYNNPRETHRYRIAVLREPNSRGGSEAFHTRVRAGDLLTVSRPRNNFGLVAGATRHVFLAGGIGITPLLAMVATVHAQGEPFHLYYCTRNAGCTAFFDELRPWIEQGCVTVHHDDGDPQRGLDLAHVLRDYLPGTHLYACGPGGFLDAIDRAAGHWPAAARHSERFSAPAHAKASPAPDSPFEVRLAGRDCSFTVPAGQTIVAVLQQHGVEVDVSCCEGYCGTCMTRYLDGEPIHRDSVLDAEDRAEFVMVCCARAHARGGPLVLDL